jgi:hypothetical protein
MANAKMIEMHLVALSIPLQIPGSWSLLLLPGQRKDLKARLLYAANSSSSAFASFRSR